MDSTTTAYSFDEVENAQTQAAPATQRPEVLAAATPTETPPTQPGTIAVQFAFFAALDRALIKYITTHASRLLHAEKPSAWRSFQTANAENAEKYTDFTPAALCEEFVRRVLPQVFSWDLTEHEVRMLQLLDSHPEFERVAEGFVHKGNKGETNRMDSTTTAYSFDEVENALDALFMSPPATQRPEVLAATPTETPPTQPGATAGQFAFFAALDRALIKYITTHASRLLHAEKPSAWRSFQTANAENAEKYTDFTPAALCEEFVRRVLPQVFSWDLTEREVRMLQLLDLHPEFERVAEGFVHVPWQRRVASCRAPQPNVDFRLVNAADANPERMFPPAAPAAAADFALASQQSAPLGLQHHTLVLTQPYKLQQGGYSFNFSRENSALLSAALSNNFELSGCVRLEPKELHKRLRAAKREFEQYARMPENCSDATKLLAKMQTLKQLRETIVDIMSKSYL